MMAKTKPQLQYAALPISLKEGKLQVLLITSRDTGRWIVPKGWAEKNIMPWDMAAREAYEEAGVVGVIDQEPAATYHYDKRLSAKKSVACIVDVYLLEVEQELDDWPEKAQRERRWMTPAQAAYLISEGGLVELLLQLAMRGN